VEFVIEDEVNSIMGLNQGISPYVRFGVKVCHLVIEEGV
jgi:hypothetical protein